MLALSVEQTPPPVDTPPRREVNAWRDANGQPFVRLFEDMTARWIDWPGLGLFRCERGHSLVRVWPASAANLQALRHTFEHRLQPLIMQATGHEALHASASLSPSGVVAFCGQSGAGKSTLAYGLRGIGWPQLADDALALSIVDGAIVAHALPFEEDLRPGAHAHFSGSSTTTGARLSSSTYPLALVVLLQQAPDNSRGIATRTIAGPDAFQRLLTHAHAFDSVGDAPLLARDYLAVAAAVPVVELTYPADFTRWPELTSAISRLAASAGRTGPPVH